MSTAQPSLPEFLTEKSVSELTGFSLSKLQQDRHYGRGLPYCKVGRAIRYRRVDVDDFMNRHMVFPRDGGRP